MLDKPKCPYCEKEFDMQEDFYDFPEIFEEDDITELDCPNCEKLIHIETTITYDFNIKKPNCKNQNKEHKWKITGYSIYTRQDIPIDYNNLYEERQQNPPEKWEYWRDLECKKCDETTINKISKEDWYKESDFIEEKILENFNKYKITPNNAKPKESYRE